MEIVNLADYKGKWMKDFKDEMSMKFDVLPIPKWKRVKLDGFKVPDIEKFNEIVVLNDNQNEGLQIRGISETDSFSQLRKYIYGYRDYEFDEKFVSLAEGNYKNGFLITTDKNFICKNPVRVEYNFNRDNKTLVDFNLIVLDENSSLDLVIDFSGDEKLEAFHCGIIKVIAGRNSKLNITKIQRLGDNSNNFDINIAYVDEGADVRWTAIELGSDITAASYISNLKGRESSSSMDSVYFGDKERRLDLGYTMNHYGIGSTSNIEVKGVLKDSSKKVFRGNLNFKSGGRKAKGREAEYVILMDPSVKSDAIPVLFCEEDDVNGEHAASAGQMDGDKLFYLMSRGLSEREAKKLIVEAAFNPIIDKIPFNDLREKLNSDINRRLMYERN